MNATYGWVIKSKEKNYRCFFTSNARGYFARRTSLKNREFVTTLHWHVKWFNSKEEAEAYYFQKSRIGFDLSEFIVSRKKMHLDKKGNYDYWKNRESLKK